MSTGDSGQDRAILERIAHRAMLEKGLAAEFSHQALVELDGIHGPATQTGGGSVIYEASYGAPSTMMIRVISISSPWPKPLPPGALRFWSRLPM